MSRRLPRNAPWRRRRPRRRRSRPRLLRRLASADPRLFGWVARQHAPALDAVMPRLSVAADHSKLWVAAAALLWCGGDRPGQRAAQRGMLAVTATSLVVNVPVKLAAARTRPDIRLVPQGRRLPRLPSSPSFPSGHSASAAAFATAAGLERPRARLLLAAAAATVALSRVYTGAHYPGDVVVGAGLGAGVALATLRPWPLADQAPAQGGVSERDRPGPDGDGLVVVVNRKAGSDPPVAARRLRHELPAARVVQADSPSALAQALRQASGHATAVGVAGGDGSVRTAAETAHAADLPLVVVPTGSLNHLASDVGITSVDDAVAAVRRGPLVDMDLAEIDGRVFVNAAALGLYPRLVDVREGMEPRLGKWVALVVGLARVVPSATPVDADIDGRPHRVWQVFVGNCHRPLPGPSPTNRRRLDDGAFDVRVLHAVTWARTRFLAALLTGRLHRSPVYEQRLAAEVRVSAGEPLRLAVDGETFSASSSFAVRKRPRPLRLLVPDPSEARRR